MKTRAALIVAALGTASSVFAQTGQPQTQGTATWNLSYFVATPTTAGNWASGVTIAPTAGGTIGLNQAALIRLTFNLSGTPGGVNADAIPTGSPLTWSSTLGGSGAGGLGGLFAGDLNVTVSEATGGWSNGSSSFQTAVKRQILSPYATGGGNGLVNGDPVGTGPSGAVTDIQPAQFGADAAILDHGNGVVAWRGLWIPSSYTSRTVNFNVGLGTLGFLTRIYAIDNNYGNGGPNDPLPIALNVATLFGPGASAQVVPGPSSLALLGLGGLIAARRRRA